MPVKKCPHLTKQEREKVLPFLIKTFEDKYKCTLCGKIGANYTRMSSDHFFMDHTDNLIKIGININRHIEDIRTFAIQNLNQKINSIIAEYALLSGHSFNSVESLQFINFMTRLFPNHVLDLPKGDVIKLSAQSREEHRVL